MVRDGGLAGRARHFFARRARRILPPFYAALALSLLWSRIGALRAAGVGIVSALLLVVLVGMAQQVGLSSSRA